MIATRSPTLMFAAIKPFATARTSLSNSLALTPCQPWPSGRDSVMRFGSFAARSATKSERLPLVAGGTIAGTVY